MEIKLRQQTAGKSKIVASYLSKILKLFHESASKKTRLIIYNWNVSRFIRKSKNKAAFGIKSIILIEKFNYHNQKVKKTCKRFTINFV